MARAHFGTDGVRGIVGETLTLDLVERFGRAATMWAGRGRVFVGRDTRSSGPALEQAVTRGIVSAGGTAVLAGVLPTPAVALLAQDLGIVLSASHNPPEYNGIKFFDAEGHKLADEDQEAIEALLDAPGLAAAAPSRRRKVPWRAMSTTSSSTSVRASTGSRSRSTVPTAPTLRSRPACSSGSAPR